MSGPYRYGYGTVIRQLEHDQIKIQADFNHLKEKDQSDIAALKKGYSNVSNQLDGLVEIKKTLDDLKESLDDKLFSLLLFRMSFIAVSIGLTARRSRTFRCRYICTLWRPHISNARIDGNTFTQDWCKAFDKLSAGGDPFTCYDIINEVQNRIVRETFCFARRMGFADNFPFFERPDNSTAPSYSPDL
ncbi:hypothetical protein V8E54_000145 [Elaphomyces granulatus]